MLYPITRASILAAFGFVLMGPAVAAAQGEAFNPVHHVADGYYLDFEPLGVVELPRIFLVRQADGGLSVDVFSSTTRALESGGYAAAGQEAEHAPAEGGEATEHGVAAPEHGTPAGTAEPEAEAAHVPAELIPTGGGEILIDFSITRHLVFAVLAALIVAVLFISLARRYQRGVGRDTAPRGIFQNLFETLVVFVRDDMARPNLGDKYEKFLPYLLTVFFFILTANLMGLLPWGATPTGNLMVTGGLALFTFVLTQVNGSKDHWRHIFWPPDVPWFVKPLLIPAEIVGIFTKQVALAIRLFANMVAGHTVILSLIGLIFVFTNLYGSAVGWGVSVITVAFALFIALLEFLVAFIQAYVFTLLSALFIGMAAAEHSHDEEAGHEPVHDDPAQYTPHPLAPPPSQMEPAH